MRQMTIQEYVIESYGCGMGSRWVTEQSKDARQVYDAAPARYLSWIIENIGLVKCSCHDYNGIYSNKCELDKLDRMTVEGIRDKFPFEQVYAAFIKKGIELYMDKPATVPFMDFVRYSGGCSEAMEELSAFATVEEAYTFISTNREYFTWTLRAAYVLNCTCRIGGGIAGCPWYPIENLTVEQIAREFPLSRIQASVLAKFGYELK